MTKARNIADLGSNDVIETTATGVDVTGTVTADGFQLGAGDKLYFNADRYFTPENNVDGAEVSANGKFTVKTGATPSKSLVVGATGDVSFYEDTGTTAKMVWDASAESLGIGTSPSSTLHVKGGSISTPATASAFISNATSRLVVNHVNEYGVYVGYANSSNDAIGVQSARSNGVTSPLLLNPYGGNVGIGTASPSTKLMLEHNNDGAVGGTIRIKDRDSQQDANQLTGAIEFESQDASVPTGGVSTAIKAYSASNVGGSYLTISTTDVATSTLDERMRIDSSGNVGIGSASPSGKIDIVGAGGQDTVALSKPSNGFPSIKFTGTSSSTYLEGGDDFRIYTGATPSERARLDSSGNLLVGTTTGNFSAKFVVGNSSSYTFLSRRTGTGSEGHIVFQNANGAVGTIFTSGSTTSYNTSSDERLKENIQDTTHTVDINDIRVREFDWKVDGEHQRFGFIAQELETVYPEAVHSPEDPEEMKSVDYSKLVPLLVKEIQTLKARIEELEK